MIGAPYPPSSHEPGPSGGLRGRTTARLALVTAGLGAATLAAATVLVVWTKPGQRADERSRWSVAVPPEMRETIGTWLNTVSVGSIVATLVVVLAIGVIRRRLPLALAAVVLVAGANVTTQILKGVIPRPSYGVGPLGNSLPSGHTTAWTTLGLALLLVAPRPLRPVLVLVASAVATFTGASTVLERWHRPSDVIAAFGVCAIWSGVLLWALLRRRADVPQPLLPGRVGMGGRLALHLGAGILGAILVGVILIVGGLVAHETPTNVIVGAVMLTATGVTGAILAALVGTLADEYDRLGLPRAGRSTSGATDPR